MRKVVVFYSWQSDRPAKVNRTFIGRALEDAAKQLNAERSLGVEIVVDQGTQGVSGTPPVSQTILDKIGKCDIFLPDVTYVAAIEEGDKAGTPVPNPNVMTEYGHALSVKGHGFMMPVMNVAYGGPGDLPFDMGHLRHPIQYAAPAGANDTDRRRERSRLAVELANALKITIQALPAPLPPPPLIPLEVRAKAREWRTETIKRITQAPPVPMLSGPRLGMHLIPASAFSDEKRADLSSVQQQHWNLVPSGFRHRRSNFDTSDRPHADGWLVFDTRSARHRRGAGEPRMETGSRWHSQVYLNGIVEIVTVIDPKGEPEDIGPKEFDGVEIEREIVETLDRAALTYAAVGMTGPAMVMVSLISVFEHRLFHPRAAHSRGFEQPSVELPDLVVADVTPPLGRALRPLLDDLWRAAGWPMGSPSYIEGEWSGYSAPAGRATPPRVWR
jgi:hypothetical protein